jgi:hypothetical protein
VAAITIPTGRIGDTSEPAGVVIAGPRIGDTSEPAGVVIAGPRFADARLIALAYAIEQGLNVGLTPDLEKSVDDIRFEQDGDIRAGAGARFGLLLGALLLAPLSGLLAVASVATAPPHRYTDLQGRAGEGLQP